MAGDTFQLGNSAAAIYEQQKVPAIFGPLAEATLDRVPLAEEEDVLDVACGTGILARKVRERHGNLGRVVGADLNEGMISTALGLMDQYSQACEWHVADASNMPFEDNSFSSVFCQQGLQFFPDEDAALIEMKRLLRPGGRIALSIWSRPPALFVALAEALKRHIDEAVAKQSLAPFGYEGRETLLSKLEVLGFSDIERQEFEVDRIILNPKRAIPKEIAANPIGPAVAKEGKTVVRMITEEVLEGISQFRDGDRLTLPQATHLVMAIVA